MKVGKNKLILISMLCAAFAAQAQTVNVVNAVTNGATSVSGEYTLTGVGGVTCASLSLEAGAKWTFDPIRTPVFVGAVPTFAEGAKIALAANYTDAAYQNGRLTLFTWAGTAEADVPTGLLDAATVPAGANPVLMQETYTSRKGGASAAETTYTRLVLDMNPSATRPTITILPLGDSLTENSSIGGMHANPNYRVNLLKKLAARGWAPKSVGYRHSANLDSAGVGQPEEWSWHNGMSGNRLVPVYTGLGHPKTVSGYRESLEPMIESCESPDVILFMIGANDSNGVGYTMDELYASWTNVLWRLIRMRPATRIICSPTLYMSAPTGAWETEWTARITQAIGGGRNEPGFPSGHVFFADVRSSCPRVDDAGNYLGYFMTKTDVHPNWIGHDFTSDAWLAAIEEAMKSSAPGTFTPNEKLGAEANVDAAYRAGFEHLYTLDLKALLETSPNRLTYQGTVPWSFVGEGAGETRKWGKVAYYLELRNPRSGHVRWVWADMETWGDRTVASFDVPNHYRAVRRVKKLHVDTNDAALGLVPPTCDSVDGWIQFGWSTLAWNGAHWAAPVSAGNWDWNDEISDDPAGIYGAMQVYRIAPMDRPTFAAETLFAWNRFMLSSKHEIGIGNCAVGTAEGTTFNYYGTGDNARLGMGGYDIARLEIWANPDVRGGADIADRTGTAWFSADALQGLFNGLWDETPPVENDVYRTKDGHTYSFTIGNDPAFRDDIARVENEVNFTEPIYEADLTRYDLTDVQGAITVFSRENGALEWKAYAGGEWVTLTGVAAALGGYTVRMDATYGAKGRSIRYSVRKTGEDDFVVLRSGLEEWLPNSVPAAAKPTQVVLAGKGEVSRLAGLLKDLIPGMVLWLK